MTPDGKVNPSPNRKEQTVDKANFPLTYLPTTDVPHAQVMQKFAHKCFAGW